MKILINTEGDKYYVKNPDQDFTFNKGHIKKADLKKGKAKSNKGHEFYCFEASFADKLAKIPRPTQIEQPKDIAGIMAEIPFDKDSIVVDSGLGSGGFSIFMSRYVKHIYAFEKEKRHHDAAVKNLKRFNISNVTPTLKNINKGIPVKDVDVIHLDLPEPWKALKACADNLKQGGYAACYLPSIGQVRELVTQADALGFATLKVKEILERAWKITDRVQRPHHTQLVHTAFLVILRKYR